MKISIIIILMQIILTGCNSCFVVDTVVSVGGCDFLGSCKVRSVRGYTQVLAHPVIGEERVFIVEEGCGK